MIINKGISIKRLTNLVKKMKNKKIKIEILELKKKTIFKIKILVGYLNSRKDIHEEKMNELKYR